VSWAVFLDRDGVLTEAPLVDGRPTTPTLARDLRLLPGTAETVIALRALGARIFVVTNQPDIARNTLDSSELAVMHEGLSRALQIDAVQVCPHDGWWCPCRKPRPGMLLELAREWDVDLHASWMVGDRWVDIAAGSAAGTRTILIDRPYSWSGTGSGMPPSDLVPDHRVDDLARAVRVITVRSREGRVH